MQKLLFILAFLMCAAVGHSQKVKVVAHSKLAKMIAKIKGEESYGITIGKTIFVSCSKEDFFAKQWWVSHEMAHVAQYQKLGVFRFLSKYAYYEVFHHKSINPFEFEAEVAEHANEVTAISSASTSSIP